MSATATATATIHFAPPTERSSTGRDLVQGSELAQFLTRLRKDIGRTYLNGSLNVRLYHDLPREDGQTILRNRRLIDEKVVRRAKFMEGKTVDLGNLGSYGILKDRFVLYLPKEGQHEDLYVTIAQYPRDITADQQGFLKRQVLRATAAIVQEETAADKAPL